MKRTVVLLLLLAGCAQLPRDTDGTLEHIAAHKLVRVGIVADAHADRRRVEQLLQRIGREAGARVAISTGATETLLAAMEEDQIDLVVAPFANETPLKTEVSLAPPLARYSVGKEVLFVRAAVRNGENRWASLVERVSRSVAPELAHEG